MAPASLICNFAYLTGFPGGSEGKASACNVGDPGSIPGLGRSPRVGNCNPFQYCCLENPMDGESGRLQCMRLHRVDTTLSLSHMQTPYLIQLSENKNK